MQLWLGNPGSAVERGACGSRALREAREGPPEEESGDSKHNPLRNGLYTQFLSHGARTRKKSR